MSGEGMSPPCTACVSLSWFVQVTVSPTPTVRSAGWKEKSRMATEAVAASERVAAQSPTPSTASVATSNHRRRAETDWMRAVMGSGRSLVADRSRRRCLGEEDGGEREHQREEAQLDPDEGDERAGGEAVRLQHTETHLPSSLGGDDEKHGDDGDLAGEHAPERGGRGD